MAAPAKMDKEPRFYEKGPKRVALIGEVQSIVDASHVEARSVLKFCILLSVLALVLSVVALARTL